MLFLAVCFDNEKSGQKPDNLKENGKLILSCKEVLKIWEKSIAKFKFSKLKIFWRVIMEIFKSGRPFEDP